jgi:hypothetical protein
MDLSCGRLIAITLLYFALPGGRHSGGSLICLTIRIPTYYQLSVTHFLFSMNCKRSARFFTSCLFSPSCLLRSVSWYSVGYRKYDSLLGANALYCCNRFDWVHDLFLLNSVDLNNGFFYKWHNNNLTDIELNTARSLLDIILIIEKATVCYLITLLSQNPKLLILLLRYAHSHYNSAL